MINNTHANHKNLSVLNGDSSPFLFHHVNNSAVNLTIPSLRLAEATKINSADTCWVLVK